MCTVGRIDDVTLLIHQRSRSFTFDSDPVKTTWSTMTLDRRLDRRGQGQKPVQKGHTNCHWTSSLFALLCLTALCINNIFLWENINQRQIWIQNLNVWLALLLNLIPPPQTLKDGTLDWNWWITVSRRRKMASDCSERLSYSANAAHYNVITIIKSYSAYIRAAEGCGFACRCTVETAQS